MTELAPRLAQQTLELCRIPSVYGDEAALCDWFETWAAPHFGEHVRRIGHSLVLGAPRDGKPTVALVGHLDTVPGHEGDPEPALATDRIVALGASDMKAGVAVMMALAEDLNLDALPVSLMLVLYDKEEGPILDSGLGPVMDSGLLAPIDLAFVMEPTDGELQVGCVGSVHATIAFVGRRAHSARPWHGENAVHKAGELLARLHTLEPTEVRFAGQTFREVFTITQASGGRYRNVVPDRFELNLNYRFAPGKSLDQARDDVRALVGEAAELEFTDLSPSGKVPVGNPLFERFARQSGAPLAPKQAWTDVARLTEAGIDAVNYGPGLTAQAHQGGEYALIEPIADCYRRLRAFLESA